MSALRDYLLFSSIFPFFYFALLFFVLSSVVVLMKVTTSREIRILINNDKNKKEICQNHKRKIRSK